MSARDRNWDYREIFAKSRDGYVVVSLDGRIIDANRAYCEMLGYTLEELRALESFYQITPERWHAWEAREIWDEGLLKCGYSGLYEKEYIRKDGTVFPIELQSYVVRDAEGNIQYLWGMARDISARKAAECKLRDSEERYRALVMQSSECLILHDPGGRIHDVNARACATYGYSRDELLRMKVSDLDPDYEDRADDGRFYELMVPGEPLQFEARQRSKSGREFPVEVRLSLVEIGGQHMIQGLCRDITERRRLEEEQKSLQQQLLQAQKLESVGRLAGGVAHDFNNMLSVILGHAELAGENVSSDSPVRFHLNEIQQAAQRSAGLTRQLLAFARRQMIAPRALDLNASIESLLTMLERLIGESIDLRWQPGEQVDPVLIDPAQVDQLLTNLVVNARDAIDGIGRITIGTDLAELQAAECVGKVGARPGRYLVLTVADDGQGMEGETLAHIFEPFYTTKAMGESTGLGLATVYGIVDQNHGFIEVESEPEVGTTFRIYLPALTVAGEAHSGGRGETAPSNEPRVERGAKTNRAAMRAEEATILLVEDERAMLSLGAKLLAGLGFRVLAASTPKEALHRAQESSDRIDLLITDVVMPEMNGYQLAERLRGDIPDLPCLYVSGYSDDALAEHHVLEEDVSFLQKPFTRDELTAAIRQALPVALPSAPPEGPPEGESGQ